MRIHRSECIATSLAAPDFVDLTERVREVLMDSGIGDGQVTVFAQDPHCVLMLNERETGLLADIKGAMKRLGTTHPDHGRAMIGSTSVVVPAVGGELRLGTWQRVLLVELSEARDRSVVVQIVGD
jgi:secondary thiamine-phosphate synthase enzyme